VGGAKTITSFPNPIGTFREMYKKLPLPHPGSESAPISFLGKVKIAEFEFLATGGRPCI